MVARKYISPTTMITLVLRTIDERGQMGSRVAVELSHSQDRYIHIADKPI
jgi:hypothetical protein